MSGPCRFSLCPASPERPLCIGDGLRSSDTVSGRAEQKEALGHAAGNIFSSGAPQIPLSDALEDTAGDALNCDHHFLLKYLEHLYTLDDKKCIADEHAK
jgi:hypothetical protein